MKSELMLVIAKENLKTHIEKELEEKAPKTLADALHVWITR